ncbi:MAG TPA: hypothetical protein VFP94_01675 [Terriglobales bacterium]|nr:hypothetical protein [Terriglobales bacterium]
MEGRLLRLLRTLHAHQVQFILVGGLSAVLQGAPVHTQDVDIVPLREPENLTRLLAALQELGAVYRTQPDVLGAIGRDEGYEQLLPQSHDLEIADNLRVRVLDLEAYIGIKAALGSEKDLAVLPILRQTLRERQRDGKSE